MSQIRNVKLELLRSGPAHNQLLSPLTLYYVICGREGGLTIKFPFEHRQLLNRLTRLRYVTKTGAIPAQQREAEVRELGEIIGQILGQIPTLVSELAHAGNNKELVHLRLVMSSYELALIPYELAIASDGFPASGSPLFLQANLPITLTREVRHGQPLPVNWNRPPRILFVYASPEGFDHVPLHDHLKALRRAIAPWVKWKVTAAERIQEVKKLLTVIPNASLEQIRLACLENEYTHIHILAHGAPYQEAGEQHFGLALSNETNIAKADIVSGERLAIALTANDSCKGQANRPSLVSLSTCDSGNVNTVLTPAGSIAHALHAGGIPWVIASQFPLWMRASSLATEVLFAGILKGTDPRYVLYKLRQRLRTDSAGTHDWASIVAYSTLSADFEQQVEAFRDRQIRSKLGVKFDIADECAKKPDKPPLPEQYPSLDALFTSIRNDHEKWLHCLPTSAKASDKSEILGMRAAAEKRMGLLLKDSGKSRQAFANALDYYKQALDLEPLNFWVLTQFLAMNAAINGSKQPLTETNTLEAEYNEWWLAARQIARWKLDAANGIDKAWAYGTLAELELLSPLYNASHYNAKASKVEIKNLCQQLVKSIDTDKFPIFSTNRQFGRYLQKQFCNNQELQKLAAVAIAVFDKA